MISEGCIKDRVERLAQKIFNDFKDKEILDLFVIMNSAFKFFSDLLSFLSKLIESRGSKLMLRPTFFKITSYQNNEQVVD